MTSHAASLVLPPTEDPRAWADAVALSGLEQSPGRVLLTTGPPWRLMVQRPDGTQVAQEVSPPKSPEDREAIAILAVSLLTPVRLDAALPPLPPAPEPPVPPPAPPPASVAKPKPTPVPKPAPNPVPKPAPKPIEPTVPAPQKVDPSPPKLRSSSALAASFSQATDQGTGIGATVHVTVDREGPLFAELGARWITVSALDPLRPDRTLRDTGLWLGAGWSIHPKAPAPRVGLGGSGRTYRFDDRTVADVDVPWLDVGLHYDLGPPSLGARLSTTLRRDLRNVVLASQSGIEGAVSPWAATLSVAVRAGRIGATRKPR